jgi:hypothetical protein
VDAPIPHLASVSLVRFGLLSLLVIERRARCPFPSKFDPPGDVAGREF